MKDLKVSQLELNAYKIRYHALKGIFNAKSGHPGGSFSIADLLSVLYFHEMNVENPKDKNRDRFVLSKGHTAPAYYATLALKGFFDVSELESLRSINSNLQGHPDMKKVKGVDMSTGSLGQGISAAVGMALCAKAEKQNYRVYTILGDGEIQEGQVWEAAMAASHYKLDNLVVIIDNNNLQIDGEVSLVMNVYPITEKFKAFGFNVLEIDGNNIEEILRAFEMAKNVKDMPTCIVAKTVKGKGVSFMENQAIWHGQAPNAELYEKAQKEIVEKIKNLGGEV